jgi:hypothetical protein
MTDLINRVNELEVEILESLYQKYLPLLQMIEDKEDIPYLAYIINLSVNYLNTKHEKITPEWKAWGVVAIKRLFHDEKIKTKEEIFEVLDKFYEYKKSEYKKYVSNIALYSDEYYRDSPFVDRFIKQL